MKEIVDVRLNLDFTSPRLPYSYIDEGSQRISLMKRFAEAQDMRVVRALEDEMRDRFGPLPPEAREFVSLAGLRVACAAANIGNIDTNGTKAVFHRAGSRDVALVVDLKSTTSQGKISELLRAAVKARKRARGN